MIERTKKVGRRQTDLAKSTFASDPVKFEVVEIDLISEVDGFRRGATHVEEKAMRKWWGKEWMGYGL